MSSRGRRREAEERLSHDQILQLAGSATFARALIYQQQDRVEGLLHSGSTVAATVRGTVPYRVKLAFGARPTWSCECPVGVDGKFCKHCAALAIELLDPDERTLMRSPSKDRRSSLADTVAALSREQLEEIVRLAAVRDPRVAQAIETAAAAATGTSLDVEQWNKRIDRGFRTGGFVPYAEAPGWAAGVTEVLDGLKDLVDSGYAGEVLGLAERAHRKLERSMGRVDDSGGEVVFISGVIADLHLRAAVAASPQSVAFARRLVKLELEPELDTFRRAALTYADLLGSRGLREYRKLVEPKWRKAIEGQSEHWSRDRFVATEAMIGVALADGNPDELVEIMCDRMRTPDDYLEIARAMERAGRRGEAIRWSRRGLMTTGTRYWQTGTLREFLASLYVADGDDQAAEGLWWEEFRARPSVDSYRRLIAATRSLGPDETRDQAIGELRARTESADDDARASQHATDLVDVLLYEGQADGAWEVATRYGVGEQAWMKLAQSRESQHPLDAIPIYERAAAARVATKNASGYQDAVRTLKRIEKLAAAGGDPDIFRHVLARLVEEHARKSNLMGLLRRAGWI
ncbi:MAG: SWIM zinc finger family protein [Acidimicrobiales bacterium]